MPKAKIVRRKDGELRLENFYTPLAEAKKEIWRRWNNKKLKKKVEDFLGGDVPDFLKNSPKAYLARQLNTPDKEFLRFLKQTKKLELEPICPEYLSDKFSSKNGDKYYLGKLYFHNGKGKNGGDKIDTLRIIDYCLAEGEKISSLETSWNENLADFHHTILKVAHPEINDKCPDLSPWITGKHKTLPEFYKHFLSFFICHAVLLESFIIDEEKALIEKFVLPQFNQLWEKFKIKPIIVRLLPQKNENDQIWCCHPASVKKLLRMMVAIQ